VDTEKVKDSTAVYGLSITIEVTMTKGEQLVRLTTNNPQISLAIDFSTLDKLKKVDYRLFMRGKEVAKFSFKVYFLVYDSKYNPHLGKLEDVHKSIDNLFLKNEFSISNLGSMLIWFDKKIYN